MHTKALISVIIVGVVALLVSASVYVVQETERAVVLRFGRMHVPDVAPGLHVKLPLADQIRKFDGRIQTVDASPQSFYTVEKKRLIVDSFAKWRIVDVDTYYRATGGIEQVAKDRLAARVNDGLRNEFGTRTVHEAVSGQRDQLMQTITEDLSSAVQPILGIEVVDIRVKRIDFPPEVSQSVFNRMGAERQKQAREYRSMGREEAEKIMADADRQRTIIEAQAYRNAELVRGEGDAQATAIYASAFNKNEEFYSFTRSLKAYTQSFSSKADILLIEPDSDFFRYLKDANAGVQ